MRKTRPAARWATTPLANGSEMTATVPLVSERCVISWQTQWTREKGGVVVFKTGCAFVGDKKGLGLHSAPERVDGVRSFELRERRL